MSSLARLDLQEATGSRGAPASRRGHGDNGWGGLQASARSRRVPGGRRHALARRRARRAGRCCAGWVAKMLPPTSGGAYQSFDRMGAEFAPIPRVSVRRSAFAFLLTMLDRAPAIESRTLGRVLPRCTRRRCNLTRDAPPRLQRCRSSSSASSHRTRA